MSRLAVIKAKKADELRRAKDKSRKTQALLGDSKKVVSSNKGESPEKTMTKTGVSSGGQSASGSSALGKIVIDLLLFGTSA